MLLGGRRESSVSAYNGGSNCIPEWKLSSVNLHAPFLLFCGSNSLYTVEQQLVYLYCVLYSLFSIIFTVIAIILSTAEVLVMVFL